MIRRPAARSPLDCPKGCTDAVKVEAGPAGATYSSVEYRPVTLREHQGHFRCPDCGTRFELQEQVTGE